MSLLRNDGLVQCRKSNPPKARKGLAQKDAHLRFPPVMRDPCHLLQHRPRAKLDPPGWLVPYTPALLCFALLSKFRQLSSFHLPPFRSASRINVARDPSPRSLPHSQSVGSGRRGSCAYTASFTAQKQVVDPSQRQRCCASFHRRCIQGIPTTTINSNSSPQLVAARLFTTPKGLIATFWALDNSQWYRFGLRQAYCTVRPSASPSSSAPLAHP